MKTTVREGDDRWCVQRAWPPAIRNLLILCLLPTLLSLTLIQLGCIGLTGTTTPSSSNASSTTDPPPSITTQPASQTVTTGQQATFSVAATGTPPLTYQWNKNGGAISGATASSYTTPATVTSDNGTQFSVIVS